MKRVAKFSLTRFSRFLIRIYWSALRRPALTVTLLLGVTLSGMTGLTKLQTLISFRDLFEKRYSSVQAYDEVESLFAGGNSILLLARPRTGEWSDDQLCRFRLWLSDEYATDPEIYKVTSPFDLRRVESGPGFFRYQRIIEPNCDNNPNSPNSTASKIVEIAHSPWGGVLTDREGKDLAVEIVFRDTRGGSRFGRFDPKPIGAIMGRFKKSFGEELSAVWAGPSMYDYYVSVGMKRAPIMNLAVLILILCLYRIFVGSWRSGLVLALTLILTGFSVFGWMARTGNPVDILSSMIFLITVVSAHQDFSYISALRMERKENFRRTFRRFLIPSFFTSLTTILGFISLCVSDIEIIRRFGLWAAVGGLLEWIMILIFLPCLMSLFPKLQDWTNAEKALSIDRVSLRAPKIFQPRRGMSQVLIALLMLVPWAVINANVSDDPKAVFPVGHPFRQSLNYLDRTRGWDSYVTILFHENAEDKDREPVIEKLQKEPIVEKVETGKQVIDYLKHLQHDVGLKLIDTELGHGPFFARYRAPSGKERAIIYLRSSDLLEYRAFKARVEKLCEHSLCTLSGPLDMYTEYTYLVSRTLTESLVVSLLLVSLVMGWIVVARGIPNGFYLWVTSFWGPMIMLVVLALFQVPLNIYTCNFGAILVGLTGDNAIQFMFAARNGKIAEGVSSRRNGAVFTSIVMSLCSLTFILSAFQPPRTVGLLLFSAFILCLFGDYWILKGLLRDKPSSTEKPSTV